MSRRIVLIGPLPRTRVEGVSIGFQFLADSYPAGEACVVNTNWRQEVARPGRFGFGRAFEVAVALLRAMIAIPTARAVYFTASTSPLGFLRDAVILLWATLFRRRTVAHLKGGGMRAFYLESGRLRRGLLRFVYRGCSVVVVLGERLRSQFRFTLRGDRVAVVSNGYPGVPPLGPELRQLGGEDIKLLYLSNLMASKGVFEFLAAVKILNRTSSDRKFRGVLCGDFVVSEADPAFATVEELRAAFESEVGRLNLGDCIDVKGRVTGQQKVEVLSSAHVFVLPTRYRGEGQPISIIEAQANGVPVVAPRFRAIPETVMFGQSAEECVAGDAVSVADAVRKIVRSEEAYRRYCVASRANFEERMRPEIHLQRMHRVIDPEERK